MKGQVMNYLHLSCPPSQTLHELWANWMGAREEVDEHFDHRMDFAIAVLYFSVICVLQYI